MCSHPLKWLHAPGNSSHPTLVHGAQRRLRRRRWQYPAPCCYLQQAPASSVSSSATAIRESIQPHPSPLLTPLPLHRSRLLAAMASSFVPGQFAARLTPQLKQNTPLRQYCPPQAQSNQCDDAATSTNYPSDFSKRSSPKQLFTNGPERDAAVNEVWRLREENRALHMRLAELSRNHEQQVISLQTQLAQANAGRLAIEQRLMALAAANQPGQMTASSVMPSVTPTLPPPPEQNNQLFVGNTPQQQQPFAPQQQQFQPQQQPFSSQQQQQTSVQSQQRRFHPYSRPQQPAPIGSTFQFASPGVTLQAPQDEKKATGGLFAYCSGFISSSLPSSATGSASVVPSASSKASSAWKFFGRSSANEDDEETGRAAPLLPLQTPPTVGSSVLRDPTV